MNSYLRKKLKLSDFLDRISVRYVQAEEIAAVPEEFMNINTRHDYRRLNELKTFSWWD